MEIKTEADSNNVTDDKPTIGMLGFLIFLMCKSPRKNDKQHRFIVIYVSSRNFEAVLQHFT